MWMWIAVALARPLVKPPPVAAPDEAATVLGGPTTCAVDVVVGPDGRAIDAQADGCSAVLHEATVAAALRGRWAPATDRTLERVDVRVRPPVRARHRDACVVAVRGESRPRAQGWVPRRCWFDMAPYRMTPIDRHAPAWCAVDVDPAVDAITVAGCSPGFEAAALAAVESWTFPETGRTWRILLEVPTVGSGRDHLDYLH